MGRISLILLVTFLLGFICLAPLEARKLLDKEEKHLDDHVPTLKGSLVLNAPPKDTLLPREGLSSPHLVRRLSESVPSPGAGHFERGWIQVQVLAELVTKKFPLFILPMGYQSQFRVLELDIWSKDWNSQYQLPELDIWSKDWNSQYQVPVLDIEDLPELDIWSKDWNSQYQAPALDIEEFPELDIWSKDWTNRYQAPELDIEEFPRFILPIGCQSQFRVLELDIWSKDWKSQYQVQELGIWSKGWRSQYQVPELDIWSKGWRSQYQALELDTNTHFSLSRKLINRRRLASHKISRSITICFMSCVLVLLALTN
ncbi:hypothetical protein SLA2020_316410 [Shorea laevis]